MRKRIAKKLLTGLLCMLLAIVFAGMGSIDARAESKADLIKAPIHVHSGETLTDTTTFTYIQFGSFPQTQIKDTTLIAKIKKEADKKNKLDVTVNGVKYRAYTDFNVYYRWDPIKWRVLSVSADGKSAVLMCDSALFTKFYNEAATATTWDLSTLRSYLNGYKATSNTAQRDYSADNFIDTAFSKNEKGAICSTKIKNGSNSKYGTSSGSTTTDKIFLLSLDEVTDSEIGLCKEASCKSATRQLPATDYAVGLGLTKTGKSKKITNSIRTATWLLRTSGKNSSKMACVSYSGEVNAAGVVANNSVDNLGYGIVPALTLDITKTDLYNVVTPENVIISDIYGVGTVHTVGIAEYRITKKDAKYGDYEVAFVDSRDFTAATVKIPVKIELDGVKYKVTEIASGAFSDEDKKLQKIEIANSVKTIRAYAFRDCKTLKTIAGGSKVTKIEDGAFYGCSKLSKAGFSSLQTIGNKAFYGCKGFKDFTVSSKVTSIGISAFEGCTSLKLFTIKSAKLTDKKVGKNAFKGFASSTVVKLPKSKIKEYKTWIMKKGLTVQKVTFY